KLSLLHPPFLLGLVTGGAVIYWFTGASMQAVTTGAYRAVEFIKANIRLEGATKASVSDSKRVVEICTQYAQKGMFNIFLVVFFSTLAVELAVTLAAESGPSLTRALAAIFFAVSLVFVWRSFYAMRIRSSSPVAGASAGRVSAVARGK